MKRIPFLLVLLVFTALLPAGTQSYSHQEYFEHYEGTQTCLECHRAEAETFFHSQHYQWKGETPNLVNSGGKKLGKINTMNDFCTNPSGTWIGKFTNAAGNVVSRGCSQCHAGLGLLPSESMSEKQLLNIDCLQCHAMGYRRDVYEEENGWVWKPILWNNPEGLDSVSKRITLPTRDMCLRCHAGAGGGLNYKRGDIEYAMKKADRSYDVHLGSGMECLDCHRGKDHRLIGRGADLSATDMPGYRLTCDEEGCHVNPPHRSAQINAHLKRVSCTSCHIPEFAKVEETDLFRDWSKIIYHEDLSKYEATMKHGLHVQPVYAWWNGDSTAQFLGDPVKLKDGKIQMMMPVGSRNDPGSKIYAFKAHGAILPVERETKVLLPIKVTTVFTSGDIDKAVHEGAKAFYGKDIKNYDWVESIRYMGLFHEIPRAEEALECLDCHGSSGRMDFKALGYDGDPLLKKLTHE